MATHKSAEPGTLVVVVSEGVRDELIEGDPDVYYIKDYYLRWPTVLVRLALIDDGGLRDLLMMAARYRSADAKKSSNATQAAMTGLSPRSTALPDVARRLATEVSLHDEFDAHGVDQNASARELGAQCVERRDSGLVRLRLDSQRDEHETFADFL